MTTEYTGPNRRIEDRRIELLERHMMTVSNELQRYADESTQYRRETRLSLKCIHDTWQEYLPLLKEIAEQSKESKARSEKLKTHIVGWGVVTAITGVIYMIGVAIRAMIEKGPL